MYSFELAGLLTHRFSLKCWTKVSHARYLGSPGMFDGLIVISSVRSLGRDQGEGEYEVPRRDANHTARVVNGE